MWPGLIFILKVIDISDTNSKPPRKEFLLLTAIFKQPGKQSTPMAALTEPCGRQSGRLFHLASSDFRRYLCADYTLVNHQVDRKDYGRH